jgi:hypothetical protein
VKSSRFLPRFVIACPSRKMDRIAMPDYDVVASTK